MAKRVTTKVTEETVEGAQDPVAIPIDVDPAAITQEESEFTDFIESLGPSTNLVKIHKIIDGNRQYCGRAQPGVLATEGEEFILKRWGGGRYYLMSFLNGRFVQGGSKTIEIYEMPKAEQAILQGSMSNPESVLLREEIQRQHEIVLKLLEGQKQTQQTAPSITDLIGALASMKSLVPQPLDITKMLPGLVDFIKLAKETAGGGPDGSGWAGTIQSAIGMLPTILRGVSAMKASGGGPVPESPGPEETALNSEQAEKKLLSEAIATLKAEAISGMDPGLVVDWISNHMEQPNYRNMAVILLNRQFETLFQVDKDLEKEPLRSWFLRVYTELRKVFIDDNPNSESNAAAGSVGG